MIEVEGADGTIVEFPDGTPNDVIIKAMQGVGGQHGRGVSPRPDRSAPVQALRYAGLGSKGFADSALETLASPLEMSGKAAAALGISDYQPGSWTERLKSGYRAIGQTMAQPVDAAIQSAFGPVDAGPATPESGSERFAYGAGRGAADAATMLLPAAAASKMAQTGSLAQRLGATLAEAPKMQLAAGSLGGAVGEASESPLLGAATAVAAPLAAQGLKSGAESLIQRQLDRGTTYGARKINDIVTEMGGGDFRRGLSTVQDDLARMGPDTALVDVLGIRGHRLARGAAGVPGGADEAADAFVRQRMAGRGTRLREAVDEIGDGRNLTNYIEQQNASRSALASPLYREAYEANPSIDSALLRRIEQTPAGKRAFEDARRMMLNDMDRLGVTDKELTDLAREAGLESGEAVGRAGVSSGLKLEFWDYVKRALDDQIESVGRAGGGNEMRILTSLKNKLVSELDKLDATQITGPNSVRPDGGAYARGRAAFAMPSRNIEAAETGQEFLKLSPDEIRSFLAKATPAQQEAYRMGGAKALNDMIGADTQSAVNRLADKKENLWERLRAIAPDDETFGEFKRLIGNEIRRAQTERFISPRAGSQTAPMGQDISALADNAGVVVDAAQNVAQGRPVRAAINLGMEGISRLGRRLTAPNPERAREIGDMMLTSDPQRVNEILQRLQQRRLASEIAPMLESQPGRAALPAGLNPLALMLLSRQSGQ